MLDEHLDRIKDGQLATGGEDRLLRRVVRAKVGRVALNDRLPHVRDAGHGGVAGEVPLNRIDRGVLDVPRRREVGFARAEIDEIDALRLEAGSFGRHRHGG